MLAPDNAVSQQVGMHTTYNLYTVDSLSESVAKVVSVVKLVLGLLLSFLVREPFEHDPRLLRVRLR